MPRILSVMLALFGAMLAASGLGPGPAVAQSATPDSAQNQNEALVRRFFDIASSGDLNDLAQIVSPKFVIRTAPPGEGSNLESLTQTLSSARAGLPDFAIRIDDLFVDGEYVVVRNTVTSTHLGDFFGTPPTGNRLQVPAIDIWRVEDGLLVENWHLEDILGAMRQIGVVPGAAAATPKGEEPDATALPAAAVSSMAQTDAATEAANEALALRFHDEIFEQGNFEVADDILAPGFVWHNDVPPGVEGVKTFATEVRAAFPDLAVTADRVFVAGDRVAILWTLSGTHEGEFIGVPATGNDIITPGGDIYRIEDGRIAEIWTVGDDLGLLILLGAFPEFGSEAVATPSAETQRLQRPACERRICRKFTSRLDQIAAWVTESAGSRHLTFRDACL